jgi:hypothetical protein
MTSFVRKGFNIEVTKKSLWKSKRGLFEYELLLLKNAVVLFFI